MNHQVRVRVLSSFAAPGEDNPGTYVCSEDEIVEKQIVNGVTYSRDEAKVTLYGVEDKPGLLDPGITGNRRETMGLHAKLATISSRKKSGEGQRIRRVLRCLQDPDANYFAR